VAAILNSVDGRRHEMSADIGSVISESGLVENVGVEVEIASLSQAVQTLCRIRFSGRHLRFPVEGDVGFFREWHHWKACTENGGGV